MNKFLLFFVFVVAPCFICAQERTVTPAADCGNKLAILSQKALVNALRLRVESLQSEVSLLRTRINALKTHKYEWVAGAWSSCSATCGGGTQTRTVTCRRDDGEIVDHSYCDSVCGSAPAETQPCNAQACKAVSYKWVQKEALGDLGPIPGFNAKFSCGRMPAPLCPQNGDGACSLGDVCYAAVFLPHGYLCGNNSGYWGHRWECEQVNE